MPKLNIGCGEDMWGDARIDRVKTKATTLICDLEKGIPFLDNYFDEIKMQNILEHVKNMGNLVDECYRVLKKGGKLWGRTDYAGWLPLYIMPTKEHNKNLSYINKWTKGQEEDKHYHLFVKSHLILLFNGFSNVKVSFWDMKRKEKWKRFLLKLLPFHMGIQHLDFEVEK